MHIHLLFIALPKPKSCFLLMHFFTDSFLLSFYCLLLLFDIGSSVGSSCELYLLEEIVSSEEKLHSAVVCDSTSAVSSTSFCSVFIFIFTFFNFLSLYFFYNINYNGFHDNRIFVNFCCHVSSKYVHCPFKVTLQNLDTLQLLPQILSPILS